MQKVAREIRRVVIGSGSCTFLVGCGGTGEVEKTVRVEGG